MKNIQQRSIEAISYLDLTNLNEDCAEKDIVHLAEKAITKFGSVAALCVYMPFIKAARSALQDPSIKIATVANFPDGAADVYRAEIETTKAFSLGADEVDLVIPYRAILSGDHKVAAAVVAAAKKQTTKDKSLKVILETGELKSDEMIKLASQIALDAGADFLKTSTGKVPVNATLQAARIMLRAIKQSNQPVGFKAAGGIKTAQDAASYLDLADEMMGSKWATPSTFRFGATGVLTDLLNVAAGKAQATIVAGY